MTVLHRMFLDAPQWLRHKGSWLDGKIKLERQRHPFSAVEQQRRMQEAEIDRWSTTSHFRWRKCVSCGCFSTAHGVSCDVCGAQASLSNEALTEKLNDSKGVASGVDDVMKASTFREVASDDSKKSDALPDTLLRAKVLLAQDEDDEYQDPLTNQDSSIYSIDSIVQNDDCEYQEPLKCQDFYSVYIAPSAQENNCGYQGSSKHPDSPKHAFSPIAQDGNCECQETLKPQDSFKDSTDPQDEESQYLDVPEALDVAPPVGTHVEILYEDDVWWPARIVNANGTRISVLSDDGEEDEIDVEIHAVRLMRERSTATSKSDIREQRGLDVIRESLEEEEDCHSDSDSDYETIDGVLDVAPPIGTLVKVLHEDDVWRSASIIEAHGSIASIQYNYNDCRGEVGKIDFTCDAVRLHDYYSDEEENCENNEDVGLPVGKTKDEASQVEDKHAGEAESVTEDDNSDDDYEYVELSGLLNEPPLAGTEVKVFHEDERWWPARIVESDGLKAKVTYENGENDEIDFECDAVRPIDYASDDEGC